MRDTRLCPCVDIIDQELKSAQAEIAEIESKLGEMDAEEQTLNETIQKLEAELLALGGEGG